MTRGFGFWNLITDKRGITLNYIAILFFTRAGGKRVRRTFFKIVVRRKWVGVTSFYWDNVFGQRGQART